MILELQYIGYSDQFEIVYPANAAIFQTALTSFVEFRLLEPDNMIKIFKPDFTYDKVFNGAEDWVKDL